MLTREQAGNKEGIQRPLRHAGRGSIVASDLKEVSMQKKSISRISMMATPMMIVCGLLASGASAMAESDGLQCSNQTLSGDYGYAAEGVLIGIPGLPPEAPFRSVGMTHFDGRGKLTWVEHTVVN